MIHKMAKTEAEKEAFLKRALEAREAEGNLRKLSLTSGLVDFTSNDYLGFASELEFSLEENEVKSSGNESVNGSGGSRLLSGNSAAAEALECEIADFHKSESGLLFGSGYLANLGLLSAVPQRGDMVLYDSLVHASIRDGIRLSSAGNWSWRHNDMEHLEELLKKAETHVNKQNEVFVVTESVFSMDGDKALLRDISLLCEQYNAHLIVDEAHAVGLFGEQGRGMVCETGIEARVFARVVTFGKALGSHGAIVLGSADLRSFLVNFSRPFIYTTALPESALKAIKSGYDKLSSHKDKILKIISLVILFKSLIESDSKLKMIPSNTPVQAVLIPGNEEVKRVAAHLQKAGFDVRPIMHPTVPLGSERLRVVLHAFNTKSEVENLVSELKIALS